jgi:hypothetical protein
LCGSILYEDNPFDRHSAAPSTMSELPLDERIRQALDQVASALQQEAAARARALAAELTGAVEEDRMAAEAQAMSTLAAEIGAARAEADDRVKAEVARARAEAEEALAADLAQARDAADQARAEAAQARTDAAQARESLERTIAELGAAREQAARADQALTEERARASQSEQAAEAARDVDTQARAAERQASMDTLDRLAFAVRRIDQATSLTDVLAALADAIARETPRTAVLVASGDAFQPYRSSGFPAPPAEPISRAAAADLSRGLPSAPLPADRIGYAAPVEVGGQPVALVYADDCSGQDEIVPSPWPEAIELLARHAALRLEALTATRAVQALRGGRPAATTGAVSTLGVTDNTSAPMDAGPTMDVAQRARRYARLLVSEIKLYNENAVREGRQHRDLLARLGTEIDRARQLYEERVPAHVSARHTYFHDELVQTLADGDPGLLKSS